MIVVCTGISGSGRNEYISAVRKYAQSKGKEIIEICIGKQMYKKSKETGYTIPNGTILEISERQLDYLRSIVFEEIVQMKDEGKVIVINTHACFRWHKHLTKAFDYNYLSKLNPDIYVTITDTIYSIFGRLERSQWTKRNNLAELLAWRDEEEFITRTFARIQGKPHYIIPKKEPPETLYNLVFEQNMKKTYISYPISAAKDTALKKVETVINELRKNHVVFNPMSVRDVDELVAALTQKKKGEKKIEISFTDSEGSERKIVFEIDELEKVSAYLKDHTISRDYTLISQSDFVAVYYFDPSLPSAGVEREIRFARDSGKDVYIYYPEAVMSPFRELDITRHFQDEKKFIRFMMKA